MDRAPSMRLRPESVIKLHDLYHRKEEDKYLIGDPQSGEFMFITPLEFRALQLIHKGLSFGHVQTMLEVEKEQLDLKAFLQELKDHRFIHKIDNHIIAAHHEVIHDFSIPLKWMGGPSVRFLFLLFSLFGVFTLIWRGEIPGPNAFFYQPYLSVTIIFVVVMGWLLVAFREAMKYAAAKSMGIEARLGFRNHFHLFLPKAYTPGMNEDQRHRMLGHGILSLTAITSLALILSEYLPVMYQPFWTMVFAIGIIEILCECLLFLDTDLAVFITLTSRIHKLNRKAAKDLKEHFKLLFVGKGKESHRSYIKYQFFYMASIFLAVLLLGAYIIPSMLGFLTLAWEGFTPSNPLYIDSFLALAFFAAELLLFSLASLRHHHLAHNALYINFSLLMVTVGTFIVAGIGVQWFASTTDTLLTVILSFALGIVVSATFLHSVMLAHPFTKYHALFERAFMPVLAACVPIGIVFGLPDLANGYLYALFLGGGMLAVPALRELWRETRTPNNTRSA